MHLILSPHLDDAVLSCGGLIHQLVQNGERVLVRTLMTGDPPASLPATPLVHDLHEKWEAGSSPYATRRQEEQAALQSLGAEWEFVGLLDAPYRTDSAGTPLYPHVEALFGDLHPDDPLLKARIDIPDTATTVYAPLAVGDHIDHRVVNHLARQLPPSLNLIFYEDFPYSSEGDEMIRARQDDSSPTHGNAAVQFALQRFEKHLQPTLVHLSDADLQAKIDAIRCYRSQLGTFWKNEAEMEAGVRRYARQVAATGAERLWIQGDV